MDTIQDKVIKNDVSIRMNRGKRVYTEQELEGYSIDIDISEVDKVIGVSGRYVYVLIKGYKQLGPDIEMEVGVSYSSADFPETVDVEWVFRCTISEYLDLWHKWLLGKKSKCEGYNFFCGVMGYMYAQEYKCIGSVAVHGYVDDDKEELGIREQYRDLPCFTVQKWSNDTPDFERG